MWIFPHNVDLALTSAMWERQRASLRENDNSRKQETNKCLNFPAHVDLALTLAMWERQRESLCENVNSMSSFNQK